MSSPSLEKEPRRSARPTLPPVAWLALATWIGAVLGEELVWRAVTGAALLPLALAMVGSAVLAIAWALVRRRRSGRFDAAAAVLLLAVAGVTVGCSASVLQGRAWLALEEGLADAGAREWVGVVTADPRVGAFGPGIRAKITEGPYRGAVLSVWLSADKEPPEYGQVVRFSAIPKLRERDETGRRAARAGEHATANAWRIEELGWSPGAAGRLFEWRAGAVERLAVVHGDEGALLRGVVLGDRRELAGSAVDEDFRILGLSHVVAVSGSHLAVVCGVVLAIGSRTRVPRRLVLAAVVVVAGAYTAMSGMALSAVRSAIMLAFGAAGECIGIRRDGIASLSVAVVGMVILTPWAVFDVGLALSVIAVAGLLVFGDLGIEWVASALEGRLPKTTSLLGATLVAQACTLPIVVGTFGMLSLAAPIANLVVVPPAEIAICTGLAGAALGGVWGKAGEIVVRAAGLILAVVTRSASALAALPGAAVSVGSPGMAAIALGVLVAVALWVRWPAPRSRAYGRLALAGVLVVTVAVGVGPRGPSHCEIVVLDVGQADAILVRDGPHSMLVDAGASVGELRQALARTGVRSLDSVILTHDHDDHLGGLAGLSGVVRVGWIGLPRTANDGDFSAALDTAPRLTPRGKVTTRRLAAGDRWRVGRAEVMVLWPPQEPAQGLHTNDTSIVLSVRYRGFSAILTGDAEEAAQTGMRDLGTLGPAAVLKVPHHGSRNGLTAEALDAWAPTDAIVSVGTGNDFGHPSAETITLLEHAGVRIWRTDFSGDIRIEVTARGYRIVPARRVESRESCETMELIASAGTHPAFAGITLDEEHDGGVRPFRPQAGLSDLRKGRAAPRARPPPPAGHGRSGG